MGEKVRELFEAFAVSKWGTTRATLRHTTGYADVYVDFQWDAYRAAYQKGRADMREAAAKACEDNADGWDHLGNRQADLSAQECARLVRALPVDGVTT